MSLKVARYVALIGLSLFSASSFGQASYEQCQAAVRKSIKTCNDAFEAIQGANNNRSQSSLEGVGEDSSNRDNAASLMANAQADNTAWGELLKYCKKTQCADVCNAVTGAEADQAQDKKTTCFTEIESRLQAARSVASENQNISAESVASGNSGAQEGQGNLGAQNVNMTNLDAIRMMQKTMNCSQTGAGNETICKDNNGGYFSVPSGPGSALKPWSGRSF